MLIEARRTETDGGHAQYRRPLLKLLDIFTRQRVNDWSPWVNATPQERLIASFGQREMVTQGGSVEADLARSATTCLTRSSVISELRHSMKGRSRSPPHPVSEPPESPVGFGSGGSDAGEAAGADPGSAKHPPGREALLRGS